MKQQSNSGIHMYILLNPPVSEKEECEIPSVTGIRRRRVISTLQKGVQKTVTDPLYYPNPVDMEKK